MGVLFPGVLTSSQDSCGCDSPGGCLHWLLVSLHHKPVSRVCSGAVFSVRQRLGQLYWH